MIHQPEQVTAHFCHVFTQITQRQSPSTVKTGELTWCQGPVLIPALPCKGSVPESKQEADLVSECPQLPAPHLQQNTPPSRLGADLVFLRVSRCMPRAPRHGDVPLAPTFSSQRLGTTLKPWPAARSSDSSTCRGSSCGFCRTRDRVREVPTRTSPKQRNGAAQKWLSNSTGGDESPASGSRGARRPLSSRL